MTKRRGHGEGSIYRNSKRYWVGQVTLPNGKRKYKYAKSQKDIQDWLLSQREASRGANWTETDSLTLGVFLDRYIADVASHTLRPKTLEAYSYLIRMHIKPELGNVRLTVLTPGHVQKLYTAKLNSGLSRRTVQFIHSVLHKALDQADKWGMVNRNVTDLVDAPTPKRKALVTWGLEEVNQFLETAKDHRSYPIYLCAAFMGLREGEVLGIHYEDISWPTQTLHVKHAVQALKGGLVITEPKTEKARRSIKIPATVFDELKRHVEAQKVKQGLIFTTSSGRPISPRNLVRHFKQTIEETGLPEIRFHDLRHGFASILLSNLNVHPKVVQELLGHSQISLTLDTYSHVLPGVQDEVAGRMNDLIKVRTVVKSASLQAST